MTDPNCAYSDAEVIQRVQRQTPKRAILTVAAELGLTMTAEFVPFSQSRNRGEKSPSLNWCVTIKRGGRDVLTTDYSAGCAHAPGYKLGDRSQCGADLVAWECEHGARGFISTSGRPMRGGAKPLQPELADVLYSLAMDYDVLDYSDYEQWASEFGYDPDSRKSEAVYRACVEIALKLRTGVGEDGMRRLREACQDY